MDRLILLIPALPIAAAIYYGYRWLRNNRRRIREKRNEQANRH